MINKYDVKYLLRYLNKFLSKPLTKYEKKYLEKKLLTRFIPLNEVLFDYTDSESSSENNYIFEENNFVNH